MSTISELKEKQADTRTMRNIASAFTEINAYKVKGIRQLFEKNRRYFEEITQVYHVVKENSVRSKKNKGLKIHQQEMKIAVTSNSHFYGNLNLEVIRKFFNEIRDSRDNLMVIGQTGISYLSLRLDVNRFRTVHFKSDFPTQKEVFSIVEETSEYDRVTLYYPRFVTMLSQKVGLLDITQTPPPEEVKTGKTEIIFEPELFKIVDFFEKQVRSLLFSRAMLETDLSRTAARLLAMNSAKERAERHLREEGIALNKKIKSLRNERLLETFSSIRSWHGQNRV